ncbi:MAG: EpsI family protein [Gemmataceae bacterium]|nr:EpsI family protein [Gemmataceae bacterium]
MKAALAAGPVVAAVAAVAAAGVFHGRLTDRWGSSGQLEAAVAAMDRVPDRFGEWAAAGEDRPLDDDALRVGGIRGHVQRTFTGPGDPGPLTLLVVCGRGGPISVHTPDVCFTGAGFRQLGREQAVKVRGADGREDTFKAARFAEPAGFGRGEQEVYWAWSADGRTWDAPDNPRLAFARKKALYKLYVVRRLVPGETGKPSEAFLGQALPGLRAALAAADPDRAPGG